MSDKTKIWTRFCQEHKILEKGVPLFDTNGLTVSVFPYGKDDRKILKRGPEMESLVISEVNKVLDDFDAGTNRFEGLIYIMHLRNGSDVLPLYIGKSEKHGLTEGKISANIADIKNNSGRFCRWGYNYAYHIGNLSAVTCLGHPAEKIKNNYVQWAKALFKSFPTDKPKLKQQIYFWIYAWPHGSIGPWKEYGPTSLTMLEYLLIGIASDVFPETLLNKQGVVRN